MDNVSPIDRSNLPDGVNLEQADGTAWMAYYAMSMLIIAIVLAEENPVYEDMVIKFLEHFLQISQALSEQGLYDPDDLFFYDHLELPTGQTIPVKVRTIAGLIPILPAVPLPAADQYGSAALQHRLQRVRDKWLDQGGNLVGRVHQAGDRRTVLVSTVDPDTLPQALREFFDEDSFLSPHGLRSVSKRYDSNPYTVEGVPGASIDYEPAESRTGMFGGNSNWRGPVWMPLNHLAIRQLASLQAFFGDDATVEYPTGSGNQLTYAQVAQDLTDRLLSIWLPGPDGRRPVYGGVTKLQEDPAWKDNLLFFEYFHADNGAGLGAMHQTGWTALVIDLIADPPGGSGD